MRKIFIFSSLLILFSIIITVTFFILAFINFMGFGEKALGEFEVVLVIIASIVLSFAGIVWLSKNLQLKPFIFSSTIILLSIIITVIFHILEYTNFMGFSYNSLVKFGVILLFISFLVTPVAGIVWLSKNLRLKMQGLSHKLALIVLIAGTVNLAIWLFFLLVFFVAVRT